MSSEAGHVVVYKKNDEIINILVIEVVIRERKKCYEIRASTLE